MSRLGILTKIRLAIGILGLGYVLLVGLVQFTATETQKHMRISSASLFPAALNSQEAEAGFERLRKHYSDAVLMQDKSALQQAEESGQAVGAALGAVRESMQWNRGRQEQAAELAKTFEGLHERSTATYAAMMGKGAISDKTQAEIVQLATDNQQFEAALHQMREALSKDFENELKMVSQWARWQRTAAILLFLVTAVCAGLLTLMVERQISGPLQKVTALLRDVAEGEGDLTKRMSVHSKDEIGELSHWFDTFMDKLQGIVRQLANTSGRLAEAGEKISAAAHEQAGTAESEKEQTSQVATSMQEMSEIVTQVSENSVKAAEVSRQAATTAQHGGSIVEATLRKMREIAESVGATAKKVEELASSSSQIGRIVGVIDDIADQTNLLALNAAIEAARAGEQGRGFAVVADEVRKLAERTTTATKEIADMIQSIQTGRTVSAMQQGMKQVEEGVTSTSSAGDSLQEIIRMSEQIGKMIAQIATAASQQSSTTEQVNRRMDQIARLVNESARGTQSSAKACQELSELAMELQTMVGNFKLEDQSAGNVAREVGKSFGASA
jgi:methyl-accepting chemotaxis protein